MGHAIRVSAHGAGLLALALLASCSSGATASEGERSKGPDAKVTIVPSDSAGNVTPDTPVVVAAQGGTLSEVSVSSPKGSLGGTRSADRTMWRSRGVVTPGTRYTVRAVAVNAEGKAVQVTSSFTTVTPKSAFKVENIVPHKDDTGLTVGVGMPIMITFDKEITDRVGVERNLIVQASKPVQGAWHWFDDKSVHFRPRHYWPANTKVRLIARLAGAHGGDGMYGTRNHVLDFKIGRSQITSGSLNRHVMRVKRNGKVIRTIPFSAGKGGLMKYHTTSGIHLAMSRENVTVMTSPDAGPGDSGYYQLTVYNTVRISNSGEYVHSAPWSVGSQGNSNVSHGCVNVSPDNAKWFLDNTLIGDPIILTGSPRRLEPLNGWGHWQETWREWTRWSSLGAGFTTDSYTAS
ncbi:Ig-like domain-containing protein [Spongiactinospora sp. TRM90649]|uniref:L,D-transpeptidase n=1 Tax=Spongiactinospora sp. TRM90649 TaxID=3031114 RepID=UPI0023F73867|nr:Ig-like domain-containing protein [Spongiactinospora sp. TRM90649]MDF5758500.1 Ig-like domain-containing protein [Spongiactinospora sp. TRM90649]